MLSYNGISLTYAQTLYHVMGPVADPSHSDQLYTQIKFKVKAILYINDLDPSIFLAPANSGDSVFGGEPGTVSTLTRIRHMLTAPRKALYWDATTPSSSATPTAADGIAAYINLPSGRDDANGPWPDPDAFSAVYVTPTAIEVTWACVVNLTDCGSNSQTPPLPLSIRWTDSITIDKYWKMTYQRTGTAIRSSNGFDVETMRRSGILLPDFPGMPGIIPPGFRRVLADYKVSPDGLRCDFRFQDEQIRYQPPYPVIDLDITQSESFANASGVRKGRVDIHVVGCQQANVIDMADIAIAIYKFRVWAASPITDLKKYLVLGTTDVRTHETVEGVDILVSGTYRTTTNQDRETSLLTGVPNTLQNIFNGGAAAANTLANGGSVTDAFAGGLAAVTATGADPTANPKFHWIGAGTTPIAGQPPTDPSWAPIRGSTPPFTQFVDPYMTGGGPDLPNQSLGWGLGLSIGLFASALKDPCGAITSIAPGGLGAGASGAFGAGAGAGAFLESWIGGGGGFPASMEMEMARTKVKFRPRTGGDPGTGPAGDPSYAADVQMQGQTDPTLVSAAYADIASENTGGVITTDSTTAFFYYDGQPGVYDFWQCMTEYHDSSGVMVLPTANPDGVNIAVQYSSPMLAMWVRWAAKRTGAPPNLPPKVSTDPNMIYIGGFAGLPEMNVGPDGVSIIYEARGIYVYNSLDPTLVDLNAAIPPFLSPDSLTPANGWLNLYSSTGMNSQSGSGGNGIPVPSGGQNPLGTTPSGPTIPVN